MLGVPSLNMYDLYTPLVPEAHMKLDYREACDLVIKGLAPMGEEYTRLIKRAFEDRWVDVYENRGKTSGAYSWGHYDAHPYILLNYQPTIDHAFTIAHEMGHALHSYYSNTAQHYTNAGYPIILAEVASTVNEALLLQYMLKTTDDPRTRMYLLNHRLDQFRGTVYRQVMFAEFEPGRPRGSGSRARRDQGALMQYVRCAQRSVLRARDGDGRKADHARMGTHTAFLQRVLRV